MIKADTLLDQFAVLEEYWDSLVQTHDIKKNREERNVMYRHAFSVACREYSNMSLSAIGKIIRRDHATVLHAVKQHKNQYNFNKQYRDTYDALSSVIADKVDRQTEEVEAIIYKRLSKVDVQTYTDSMVSVYKNKLDREQRKYEDKIDALNSELIIVRRALRNSRNREERLNAECKRLKNLL